MLMMYWTSYDKEMFCIEDPIVVMWVLLFLKESKYWCYVANSHPCEQIVVKLVLTL